MTKTTFEKLCRLIDCHEIFSLDVFDTALLRQIRQPVDVFELVGEKYFREKGASSAVRKNFSVQRQRAEKKARVKALMAERRGDITFDEIYESFAHPTWDLARLKTLELEAELTLCVGNPLIQKLYQYAISEGKRVIFISDMYHSPRFIAQLLQRNQFLDGEVFVSSHELGLTKGSGALFEKVIEKINVPAHQIFHMGDNFWSDVAMPISKGLSAIFYRRCGDLMDAADQESSYVTHGDIVRRGIIQNRLYCDRGWSEPIDVAYSLGFSTLGALDIAFGGDRADIFAACGGDPTIELLLDVIHQPSAKNREQIQLRLGAQNFRMEFLQVKVDFPWLEITKRLAVSHWLRSQSQYSKRQWRTLLRKLSVNLHVDSALPTKTHQVDSKSYLAQQKFA